MLAKLSEWIEFIQEPRPELGGLAVCPYAKLATKRKAYSIKNTTTQNIHENLKQVDVNKDLVTIFVVDDYELFSSKQLSDYTTALNRDYNKLDLAILDNDPRTPMIINDITTTFSYSYLWLIQSLSDLNKKSKDLTKTSYYTFWTQNQLDEVVTWRT